MELFQSKVFDLQQKSRKLHRLDFPVSNTGSTWGISLIFGGHDNRTSVKDNFTSKPFSEPVRSIEHGVSMIHLREVNNIKRELHNVFIKKLYRDNLFEEMLQEPDEVAMKKKRTRDTLRVQQQAFRVPAALWLEHCFAK